MLTIVNTVLALLGGGLVLYCWYAAITDRSAPQPGESERTPGDW